MHRLIFAIICLLLFTTTSQAQVNDLTVEQLTEFQDRTVKLIKLFEKNISRLGSKSVPDSNKPRIQRTTLELFIEAGEPYIDFDSLPNTGVKMQVSSLRNGGYTTDLLKKYLNNLENLRYAQVEVTSADACTISNFYKIKDGLYEAVATIAQKFVGYNENGKPVYKDITHKSIKIQLQRLEIDGEEFWDIVLGDIAVIRTQRV